MHQDSQGGRRQRMELRCTVFVARSCVGCHALVALVAVVFTAVTVTAGLLQQRCAPVTVLAACMHGWPFPVAYVTGH